MMMIMRMMMVGIFTTEAAELRQAGVRHTSKAPEQRRWDADDQDNADTGDNCEDDEDYDGDI